MVTNHPWVEKMIWTKEKSAAIAISGQDTILLAVRDANGKFAPCLLAIWEDHEDEDLSSSDGRIMLSGKDESNIGGEVDDFDSDDEDLIDDDLFDDDDDDDFDDDFDDLDDDDDDFDDFDDLDTDQDDDDF